MGGALDSARFKCYLAKATGANINNVDGMVIGGPGDTTMIPLVSKATVNGVPVSQFASKKKLEEACLLYTSSLSVDVYFPAIRYSAAAMKSSKTFCLFSSMAFPLPPRAAVWC